MAERGGYGPPMPLAGRDGGAAPGAVGKLDPELVETFIAVLDREGPTPRPGAADYEKELDFERRVKKMAEPRPARVTSRS